MPLPTPNAGEERDAFLNRCMISPVMGEDFPDRDQRLAVCSSQWTQRHGDDTVGDAKEENMAEETTVDVPVLDKGLVDKNAIRRGHLSIDVAECKAMGAASGKGWIQGYASTFNNVDLQGDVIRPGAFAKTISERVAAGKVKLMVQHMTHAMMATDVIGTIAEAREDEKGLWIHADLASTKVAQDVRKLISEGHVTGLSVGFWPLDCGEITMEDGKKVLEIKEAKLAEVTVTAFPANEEATILSVKTADTVTTELEDIEGIEDDEARADAVCRLKAKMFGEGTDVAIVERIARRLQELEAPKPTVTLSEADERAVHRRLADKKARLAKLLAD